MCFVCHSVSVPELLSHSELDPDADGSFTDAEAQVESFFSFRVLNTVAHQNVNISFVLHRDCWEEWMK